MEAGKRTKSMLPPHFYGTISYPSSQPIRISSVFMKRHGDSLGDSVFLRDSGLGETEWEVDLKAIDGETCFDKGWKEFVAFYFIKEDYLMMFEYQGHSRFLVTMFDKTSNEISYPVKLVKLESDSEEDEAAPVLVKKNVKAEEPRKCRDPGGNSERRTKAPRQRRDSGLKKLEACERVFKSEHPFFSLFIQPSHVSMNYVAGVPHNFWTSHFTGKEIASKKGLKFSIRLIGEKKKWTVVLKDSRGTGIFRGSGWRQFAKRRQLTVGEVCMFEMVKKEKVFNVYRIK